MKFKKQDIFGYPFYRVEADGVPAGRMVIPVLGWVEKDALGDGWWSYKEFPNSDATRHLHATRREAAEYLDSRRRAEEATT